MQSLKVAGVVETSHARRTFPARGTVHERSAEISGWRAAACVPDLSNPPLWCPKAQATERCESAHFVAVPGPESWELKSGISVPPLALGLSQPS